MNDNIYDAVYAALLAEFGEAFVRYGISSLSSEADSVFFSIGRLNSVTKDSHLLTDEYSVTVKIRYFPGGHTCAVSSGKRLLLALSSLPGIDGSAIEKYECTAYSDYVDFTIVYRLSSVPPASVPDEVAVSGFDVNIVFEALMQD